MKYSSVLFLLTAFLAKEWQWRGVGATPLAGKAPRYCSTPECIDSANALLQAMNTSVDPCVDFYEYACGNWLVHNPIPPEKSQYGSFDQLADSTSEILRVQLEDPTVSTSVAVNSAKKIYEICMLAADDTSSIQSDLNSKQGWPIVVGSSYDDSSFDFNPFWAPLREVSYPGIFEIFVDQNLTDTTVNIIYIDQPYLGLGRDYLVDPVTYAPIIEAYKTFISGAARALGGTDDAVISADTNAILQFETLIANLSSSNTDRRNFTELNNKLTVGELQATAGRFIDWLDLLIRLFPSQPIDFNTLIVVPELDYVNNIDEALALTPKRTIANYLLWRYVQDYAWHVGGELAEVSFEFDKFLSGATAQNPRWRDCSNIADDQLSFATGRLYVEAAFDEQSKNSTNEMVEFIRSAFIERLPSNTWMDDPTKTEAEIKAEAIRKFIAYPDWCLVDSELDAYYSGYVAGDNHYSNVRDSNAIGLKQMLNAYGGPVDKDRWIMPPALVNAGYNPIQNTITFPAAILQPPFFKGGRLMTSNFGGIGVVIGHEITHGFDDQGRQFDESGNLQNWWTPLAGANFEVEAQCIVDQYDGYCPPELDGLCLNGLNTLGENIADNGGVKESFQAYKNWVALHGPEDTLPGLESFTSEQIFFLNYANVWCEGSTVEGLQNQVLYDVHSPGKYRVNGAVSNAIEFVETFNCQGKPMDRGEERCELW